MKMTGQRSDRRAVNFPGVWSASFSIERALLCGPLALDSRLHTLLYFISCGNTSTLVGYQTTITRPKAQLS